LIHEGGALIADFGNCRFISDSDSWTPESGTVHYAAPETFRESDGRTTKIDVFSFGSILYEMIVGSPVFSPSEGAFAVIRRLRDGDLPQVPAKCGSLMQELIPRCWSKTPSDRPSFNRIFAIFESREFQLLPGADALAIADRAGEILNWERLDSTYSVPARRG
jgi:mitogen-activated protein kinase kinase kinase 7